ncbi:MAG TPA: hypothetical protein VGF61_19665 [Candidatus Acidoferrum sp.]
MRRTCAALRALARFAGPLIGMFPLALFAQSPEPAQKPTVFHVKYVSDNSVYVDAGRAAGIEEGMKLTVVEAPADGTASDGLRFRGYPHVAELNVLSIADSSSVCDIIKATGELRAGQLAFLTPRNVEDRHLAETARDSENYPIVVTFTDGDPLDSEIRETHYLLAHPYESSVVGSMRVRFGFSYGGIQESGMRSNQMGAMIDADMNHIGGTYWSFNGFWRGNLTTSNTTIPGVANNTLTDLINRTYHLGFTYQSPYSPNVAGVGRLFLPWAPSLSTIDGGYYGRKITRIATVGGFAGSTPDPTSWSYNPNQKIAGTFISFEDGDFDHLHVVSTEGVAVTAIGWKVAREFAFLENNLNWKRYVNFYNSMQIDAARTSPLPGGGSNPTGISQSYTSLHFQPISFVTFGVNHNFFRSLPTFDPTLIGTGLLDKYLFQGLSGDVRFDLPKHISVYGSIGKSKTTSDTKSSLNDAFGITLANIRGTGLMFDAHYSRFNSDFGSGQYESASLSKSLTERVHLQILGGYQKFNSPFSANNNSKFVNGSVDWSIGHRFFIEGLFGWYQGTTLSYFQWSTVVGYRFGGLRR